MCVCVCVRARVLKLRGYCSAPKPNIFSGSTSIPPSLSASRIPSLPPLTAYALFRLADLLRGRLFYSRLFKRLFSSVSSSASRAPAATSHRFSVSSRESDSLYFSDSSSGWFPPEPRSDSIFETCSIDLQQTPN